MEIVSAVFSQSNTDWRKCPTPNKPEYAFIGRSNVGKSSLINMLTDRNTLAKISSTPGKTQLINHFIINDQWFLADLPGYGYAKVSKKQRAKFHNFTLEFLQNRPNLMCTFVLIDSRIPPQRIDMEFMEYCALRNLPFALVFTKLDKLNQREKVENIENYKKIVLETWEEMPVYFITSAEKKWGRDELLQLITETNAQF